MIIALTTISMIDEPLNLNANMRKGKLMIQNKSDRFLYFILFITETMKSFLNLFISISNIKIINMLEKTMKSIPSLRKIDISL
jgi:aspartate/glutamate racemase